MRALQSGFGIGSEPLFQRWYRKVWNAAALMPSASCVFAFFSFDTYLWRSIPSKIPHLPFPLKIHHET